MSPSLFYDSLIRSLEVGSLYALMAVGLTLTMAVIKLPNFAHAELITTGAYGALAVSLLVTSHPVVVLGGAFVSGAIMALLCHWLVYRPLAARKLSTYTLILASFAVGMILRYLFFFFVDRYRLFEKRIAVPQTIWFQNDLLTLTNIFFWVLPISVGLVIVLTVLLTLTPLGRQMRALADNEMLAKVIGLPVGRIQALTWLLVGGLAGIAGALWGLYTNVHPLTGWLAILSVFAATVLGGMTSFPGTILGAYLVGLAENLGMQALNSYLGVDFSIKPAVPFVIIIGVLLLRPDRGKNK
ncbi:MAG: branched-chain amino acid ABC transporter permease [Caldilineaceae bacterium]|nr:branched-chain amino acid ABC transporter permease [Caldilineaceae bacterium]